MVTISDIEVDLTQPGLDYVPGTPFYTFLNFDESELGYRETEYFISGTATSYQSQSAFNLVTYYNAVHPTIDLFDGFLIHSRGAGSAALSRSPQATVATPGIVYGTFEYDDLGDVLGGVRTPYVDSPAAVLHGEGQPPESTFCSLYGTTDLLDAGTMALLYPSEEAYINAIDTATDAAVEARFLLNYAAGFSATILQFKSAIPAFSAVVHDSPPV